MANIDVEIFLNNLFVMLESLSTGRKNRNLQYYESNNRNIYNNFCFLSKISN